MENKYLIIALVVVAFIAFGFSGGFSSFTGMATDNILDCTDSDGGIAGDVKGHVIGSFTPTTPGRDFCINSTTVGEYYCDKPRSDGEVKEVFCVNGCSKGACALAVAGETDALVDVKCSQGCSYEGKCLVVGTRISGMYCDFTKTMNMQREGGCDNNYECNSNLCLSGECLTIQGGKNFLKDVEKTYFWE